MPGRLTAFLRQPPSHPGGNIDFLKKDDAWLARAKAQHDGPDKELIGSYRSDDQTMIMEIVPHRRGVALIITGEPLWLLKPLGADLYHLEGASRRLPHPRQAFGRRPRARVYAQSAQCEPGDERGTLGDRGRRREGARHLGAGGCGGGRRRGDRPDHVHERIRAGQRAHARPRRACRRPHRRRQASRDLRARRFRQDRVQVASADERSTIPDHPAGGRADPGQREGAGGVAVLCGAAPALPLERALRDRVGDPRGIRERRGCRRDRADAQGPGAVAALHLEQELSDPARGDSDLYRRRVAIGRQRRLFGLPGRERRAAAVCRFAPGAALGPHHGDLRSRVAQQPGRSQGVRRAAP